MMGIRERQSGPEWRLLGPPYLVRTCTALLKASQGHDARSCRSVPAAPRLFCHGQRPSISTSSKKLGKGADQHDAGEHHGALYRRFDPDRVDDVCRDEKLQPKQDRAAEIGAERCHRRLARSLGRQCQRPAGWQWLGQLIGQSSPCSRADMADIRQRSHRQRERLSGADGHVTGQQRDRPQITDAS